MGKWAEVYCSCLNRKPLPGSDFMFGRPHRHKQRLSKREMEEVAEWEQTTKNMFECGHRNGVVIELWPHDIIMVGHLIDRIFQEERERYEIFTRAGDWRCYTDELLLVTPDESQMWLLEIEEIKQALEGSGNLLQDKVRKLVTEFFRQDLGSRLDLESRLDEVAARMPSAPVAALRRNVQQSEHPTLESSLAKFDEALADATRLCHASIETGNPIRLLW